VASSLRLIAELPSPLAGAAAAAAELPRGAPEHAAIDATRTMAAAAVLPFDRRRWSALPRSAAGEGRISVE